MKRKILGKGSFGAVIQPSFSCNSKIDALTEKIEYSKSNVSKIYFNEGNAKKEYNELKKIADIDPQGFATLASDTTLCEATQENLNYIKRMDLNEMVNNQINGQYLTMKYGGIELKKAGEMIMNPQIFIDYICEFLRMYIMVYKLYQNNLVHHDIKENNILFEKKDNRMYLIDFGLMGHQKIYSRLKMNMRPFKGPETVYPDIRYSLDDIFDLMKQTMTGYNKGFIGRNDIRIDETNKYIDRMLKQYHNYLKKEAHQIYGYSRMLTLKKKIQKYIKQVQTGKLKGMTSVDERQAEYLSHIQWNQLTKYAKHYEDIIQSKDTSLILDLSQESDNYIDTLNTSIQALRYYIRKYHYKIWRTNDTFRLTRILFLQLNRYFVYDKELHRMMTKSNHELPEHGIVRERELALREQEVSQISSTWITFRDAGLHGNPFPSRDRIRGRANPEKMVYYYLEFLKALGTYRKETKKQIRKNVKKMLKEAKEKLDIHIDFKL